MIQPQQFNFKYMVIGVSAVIDGNGGVQVTMGLRKLKTTLEAIKYVYVIRHGDQAEEVVISYETAAGKTKIYRVNADLGHPEFLRFVDAIAYHRPQADLRRYDSQTAHRMMGATNFSAIIPIVMTALFTLGALIITLPWLVHGIDDGHTEVTVAQFGDVSFSPDSRNVTVTEGQFLTDAALQIETTSEGSTTIEWAIPLVPADWETGDPVYVVLKTHELSAADAVGLDSTIGVEGVLRNVMWEGLPSDEADYLRDTNGIALAPDAVEIEYQADTSLEFYLGIFLVGFIFVLMSVISVVIARKQKQQQAAAAPGV